MAKINTYEKELARLRNSETEGFPEDVTRRFEEIAGITSYKGADTNFAMGVVLYGIAHRNVYVVNVGAGPVCAIALSFSGGRQAGVCESTSYLPGTPVLLLVRGTGMNKGDIASIPIIIGRAHTKQLIPSWRHVFDTPSEILPHCGLHESAMSDVKAMLAAVDPATFGTKLQKDFSVGRPLDAAPGMWSIANSFGGGVLVAEFIALLKATENCKLEMFQFDDAARLTAEKFEERSSMTEHRRFNLHKGHLSVSGYAVSAAESMGVLKTLGGDGTYVLEDKPTEPDLYKNTTRGRVYYADAAYANFRPFYPHVKLEGSAADGGHEFMCVPPKGDGYGKDDVVAPGVMAITKGLDGSFSVKAARQLTLEKTAFILAPKEKFASDFAEEPITPKERQEWDVSHSEDVKSNKAGVYGRDFSKKYDQYNENGAFPVLRGFEECWKTPDKDEQAQEFNNATGGDFTLNETLPALGTDATGAYKPHYDETTLKEVIVKPYSDDGLRSTEYKIYDRSAGIKVLPDGTVVVYGAYGEELRLSKGNIYLTCPGDMILQPGRSLIGIAPQNCSLKAGTGSMELVGNNTVSIAAGGNMQLCAAAKGEEGVLLIENKSTADVSADAFAKDNGFDANKAKGGGLIISNAGRTIVTTPMLHLTAGDEGYSGSLLETCFETVVGHSTRQTHYIEPGGYYTLLQRSAALAFSEAGTVLSGGQLSLGATVTVAPFAYTGSFMNRKGESEAVNIRPGSPGLIVVGPASIESMNAARGGFDSTRNQWFTELRALLNNTAKDIRTDLDMASGLDSAQQNLTTVLGSDGLKTLDKVSFIFPSAKTLKSASFYLPKAYWQSILTGGDKWSEMEVDNSNDGKTMSYPGYDTWKSSSSMRSITNMSIEQSSLSSAYVINA